MADAAGRSKRLAKAALSQDSRINRFWNRDLGQERRRAANARIAQNSRGWEADTAVTCDPGGHRLQAPRQARGLCENCWAAPAYVACAHERTFDGCLLGAITRLDRGARRTTDERRRRITGASLCRRRGAELMTADCQCLQEQQAHAQPSREAVAASHGHWRQSGAQAIPSLFASPARRGKAPSCAYRATMALTRCGSKLGRRRVAPSRGNSAWRSHGRKICKCDPSFFAGDGSVSGMRPVRHKQLCCLGNGRCLTCLRKMAVSPVLRHPRPPPNADTRQSDPKSFANPDPLWAGRRCASLSAIISTGALRLVRVRGP